MRAYQGPAIYVHNNSVFTEKDLENIKRLGNSHKQDERKDYIGKFGLGFNICYNVTDVPSLVTGGHLIIFDPHCASLPSRQGGCHWRFAEKQLSTLYPDQAAPYKLFGCDLKTPYSGTLFRFPLRTADMRSQISNGTVKLISFDI